MKILMYTAFFFTACLTMFILATCGVIILPIAALTTLLANTPELDTPIKQFFNPNCDK